MAAKPTTHADPPHTETFLEFLHRVQEGRGAPEEMAWVKQWNEDQSADVYSPYKYAALGESEKKPTKPNKDLPGLLSTKEQSMLETALEIQFKSAVDEKALGFLGRAFVMATLPHKKVQGTEFERKNGNYTLSIVAPSKTGTPESFDFDICVPVSAPATAVGRVKPWQRPALRVVRTVYHGPYEGLGGAWHEFGRWMEVNGYKTSGDLYECYLVGPESSSSPAEWRTELSRPLVE